MSVTNWISTLVCHLGIHLCIAATLNLLACISCDSLNKPLKQIVLRSPIYNLHEEKSSHGLLEKDQLLISKGSTLCDPIAIKESLLGYTTTLPESGRNLILLVKYCSSITFLMLYTGYHNWVSSQSSLVLLHAKNEGANQSVHPHSPISK